MLHEKNWRVSLCVQVDGARPESANNGIPLSIMVSFLICFWEFLVGLGLLVIGFTADNGFPVLSSTHLTQALEENQFHFVPLFLESHCHLMLL